MDSSVPQRRTGRIGWLLTVSASSAPLRSSESDGDKCKNIRDFLDILGCSISGLLGYFHEIACTIRKAGIRLSTLSATVETALSS